MSKRKQILKRVLITFLIGLVVVGVVIAYGLYEFINKRVPEMYATWGAGELLVNHVEDYNTFPETWSDLKPAWEAGIAVHAKGVVTFEELQETIVIEFDRLDELAMPYSEPEQMPRVIRPVSGSVLHWEGQDANLMLNRYLLENPLPRAEADGGKRDK